MKATKVLNIFVSVFLIMTAFVFLNVLSKSGTSVHLYRIEPCADWKDQRTMALNSEDINEIATICHGDKKENSRQNGASRNNIMINDNIQIPDERLGNTLTENTDKKDSKFHDSVNSDVLESDADLFENPLKAAEALSRNEDIEGAASVVKGFDAIIENEEDLETENESEDLFEMDSNDSVDKNTLTKDVEQIGTGIDINNVPLTAYDPSRKKKKHFAFLKVHKAGSTTVQNIFFRFGLRYNLTFVLPRKGHYLQKPENVLPVEPAKTHDILSCHVKSYKAHFFKRYLPEGSVNIAIIREPLNRMISAAYYYRDLLHKTYLRRVPKTRYIYHLIQFPEQYDKEPFSRTKNSMGCDFGFSPSITEKDESQINEHLFSLIKDFNLVLVMERFDESLILLRRFMNWEISDIMYLPTNSHDHEPFTLRPRFHSKFRSTNFLDYALYETFSQIFDAKVKSAGDDFQEEVKHFQSVLALAKDFCGQERRLGDKITVPQSKWNRAFEFFYDECMYINLHELKFVEMLQTRHKRIHSVAK